MERSILTAVSNARQPALRGDYARMRPDHTIEQDWSAYTADEHALWRKLYDRQMRLVPGYACEEFLHTLDRLDASGGIPRFDGISRKLARATGWELVAVPGLIPDLAFFEKWVPIFQRRPAPVKTTVELPEELFRRAKAEAALRGRKLKDLVEEGLRLVLRTPRDRAPPSLQTLMEPARGVVDSGTADLASNPKHLKGFGREPRRNR